MLLRHSSWLTRLLLGHGLGTILTWSRLSQELESILRPLEKIVWLSDELEAINNTFVVKKHTSDLAGKLSIAVLDVRVNSISNGLFSLIWILHVVEDLINVNKSIHHHLWLLLGLLLLRLLLHHNLLRGHHLLLHDDLLRHALDLLLLLHNLNRDLTLTVSSLIWHSSVSVIWLLHSTRTTLVVEFSTTLHWTILALLSSVLHLVEITRSILLLAVHLASLHVVLHLVEHILEEVLLDLLETSVFSLLMELTAWHPMLNRKSSSSKWSRVIEPLDSFLGILNIFVENKVLSVGGIWVEVFSLAHFHRNNWTALRESLNQFLLTYLCWNVFHKEIRLKGLSDCLLNGVSIGSNLIVSL